MLEAAIFPQKYDGKVMLPEMNQGCSEGRKSEGGREAELRVHTEEALMGGRWTCLAATLRGEESEEEEYGERLWLDIVFEELSFLPLFTMASLYYGLLVGK